MCSCDFSLYGSAYKNQVWECVCAKLFLASLPCHRKNYALKKKYIFAWPNKSIATKENKKEKIFKYF